ncbi:arylsulfatase [Rugosimonospora acidiphila]|uniref:Arylsulfatase n=1 Tax=Rugosimonospora acidiphila TaxID=556531 RepID=A0ABP9RK87_9ACTN
MTPPNVLLIMTDQQRFDTIRSLGNGIIHTPNIDRLVARGTAFTNAYSPCPVCIPARYVVQSGGEPTRTRVYSNATPAGVHEAIARECGPWLASTMAELGYRTWGIGKFHTVPWDAPLGYEVQLYSEEFYESPAQRGADSYAAWIAREHPEYDWVEMLMGERTDMYYVPQLSPLPPELTVEWWAARRAADQIASPDPRPYFGFVSFIGPHPPFAPPQPFNRLYDPDRMPDPILGDLAVDHMDEQIPYMNHLVFAEDISAATARQLKARYYGEISYIDHCVGAILDAVEARPDADNTLIAFFTDHGDHLGDHHGWQKESFFEASTRIPLLVSWPARWPGGGRRDATLASLTDIFGLCTGAAGAPQPRDGVDLVARLDGSAAGREELYGFWGKPGQNNFKMMLRTGDWKLIWLANGGRTQLFDVRRDPHERHERSAEQPQLLDRLLRRCGDRLLADGLDAALADGLPRAQEWRAWPRQRIYQFDASRGVTGFPEDPGAALRAFAERSRP